MHDVAGTDVPAASPFASSIENLTMADTSDPLDDERREAHTARASSGSERPAPSVPADETTEVVEVLEEALRVAKRRRVTGKVRLTTRTETVESVAEADLQRYRIEVTRVPVGQVVDEAPVARAEGDTTIIPVVEERLVMVKQLVLVEEVRIRHVVEHEAIREPVTLRRQQAVVEAFDADGKAIDRDDSII